MDIMNSLSILLVLSFVSYGNAGPMCLKCSYAINPDECAQVVRCSDHEECYMQQFVTPSGHILYDLGCADKFACIGYAAGSQSRPIVGKRKVEVRKSDSGRPFEIVGLNTDMLNEQNDYADGRIVSCEACCKNKDICNNGGLCGTSSFNTHGGRLCFHCDQQFRPDDCDRIKLCSQDRFCQVTQTHSDTNPNLLFYKSGCAEMINCTSSPYSTRCNTCCQGELCNMNCTIPKPPPTTPRPSTTTPKPTTTTSPPDSPPVIINLSKNPSIIHNGDRVTLYCMAVGRPVPTITWEMLSTPDTAPHNILINPNDNAQLIISSFESKDRVQFRCGAKNRVGKTEKVIDLTTI